MDEKEAMLRQLLELSETPAVIVKDNGEVEWQNHAAAPMKLPIGYSVESSVDGFERLFAAWDYHRNYRVNVRVLGKPMVMTAARLGATNLLLFTPEDEAPDKVETVLLSLFHGMNAVATDLIYAIREIAPDLEEINDVTLDRKFAEVTRASYRLVRYATDMAELGHREGEEDAVLPKELPLRAFFEKLAEKETDILRECGVRLKTVLAIKETQRGNLDAVIAEKVIAILLCNAVKYGEKGAQVDLEINCDGKFVRIMVINQGAGIHGDTLPTVFSRFLQTPNLDDTTTGAGMGLAVVRELTRRHGGTTVIRSGGSGATVAATLDITLKEKKGAHVPHLASAQRFDLSLVELSDVLPLDTFLSYAVEV